MAILTKAQLEALNQSSFPDQSTEAITPAILRNYNTQTIDTLVNSLDTGSFTTDAEFNAFTSSTNSSISQLNASSASQQISIDALNTNSGSVNSSITQLNASSASQQISINSLNAATSSYATSAITASSLITASVSGQTLTFTKGDASTFGVTLPTGSGGGTINTSSFATTGSNTFVGGQRISGSNDNNLYINRAGGSDVLKLGVSDNGNTYDFTITGSTSQQVWLIDNQGGTFGNVFQGFLNSQGNTTLNNLTASLQEGYVWVGNSSGRTTTVATSSFGGGGGSVPAGTVSSSAQIVGYNIFATTGSNSFSGQQNIYGNLKVLGGNAFSIQNNPEGSGSQFSNAQVVVDMVTDPANIYSTFQGVDSFNNGLFGIGMNSYGQEGPGGFFIFGGGQNVSNTAILTAGANNNDVQFRKSNNNFTGNVNVTGSLRVGGSPVLVSSITASFATTGSNTFVGKQIIDGNENGIVMTGFQSFIDLSGFNSHISMYSGTGSIRFYTGSAQGDGTSDIDTWVNMQVNPANGALAISSFPSNNHFVDFDVAQTASLFTAPLKGMTGTLNIASNTTITGSLLISSSATNDLIISGNMVMGGLAAPTITISGSTGFGQVSIGPASVSFASASLALGTTNGMAASFGKQISSNYIPTGGFIGMSGNPSQVGPPSLASVTVPSIYAQSTGSGQFYPVISLQPSASFTDGRVTARRLFVAESGLVVTGSTALQAVTVNGTFNNNTPTASSESQIDFFKLPTFVGANGTTYSNAGINLQDYASVGIDQTIAIEYANGSFEKYSTVAVGPSKAGFAIGTGTGYDYDIIEIVDNNDNTTTATIKADTVKIQGTTQVTGSVSINNLGNGVTDRVLTYNSTTGEVRQASLSAITSASFDAAEFWSTTTQSGSAGVSGSITFNNSGSVAGISVANNSQITVSQAGTYNIQFSAQLNTDAGADTVWVWFKKNGNNISDSASKAVLANNTAQIMTVNLFDEAVANDYYELAYQTLNGHARILYEAASGNIPAIPSVILTVNQIR